MSSLGKSTETEGRLMVVLVMRGLRGDGDTEFFFCCSENILELIALMVAQSEYNKKH